MGDYVRSRQRAGRMLAVPSQSGREGRGRAGEAAILTQASFAQTVLPRLAELGWRSSTAT